MNAVRMVEIAVKEFDFRAVRTMGAAHQLPANDALCFPIYTKCIELGIPIVINVGVPGGSACYRGTSARSISTRSA